MKLCKDCKHFSGAPPPAGSREIRSTSAPPPVPPMQCLHDHATTVDYVLGRHLHMQAINMREHICGKDAELFEPKPETVPA